MDFSSILFPDGGDIAKGDEPEYFRDLNLDQVVEAVASRETEFDMRPFFRHPLASADAILYRQEALRDLECGELMELVRAFCHKMRTMRKQLVQRNDLHYDLQQFRWLLHGVQTYCTAVSNLSTQINRLSVASRAFRGLRGFLQSYIDSPAFQVLAAEAQRLASALADIQYRIHVGTGYVTVRPYEAQHNYSTEISAVFEKFRISTAKDYRTDFRERPYMNHVEEYILGSVAELNPEVFDLLRQFSEKHENFRDSVVMRFDLEVRFYIAYLEEVAYLQGVGLTFCYPELAVRDKHVSADATFDISLAHRLAVERQAIVVNSFALSGTERIFVVSGPNQGGKTTFARTFGQLHHLAALGLTVPGSNARLFVFDRIFAHFEREESIDTLRGKLQDDLTRIRDILDEATPQSVIIINEIFSSTTLADATILAKKVFERIIALDALTVCVTFLVGVATVSDSVVSLVSEVLVDRPDVRTYKLVRLPADGRSYAESVAERHRLTYAQLRDRLGV